MSATQIVEYLLDDIVPAQLAEATVRRPPRSRVWVAVFTGAEPGKQVFKSTGLTNRVQALLLARKWEAEARRQRAAWRGPRKPTIRVKRSDPSSGFSQREVALLMKMSIRGVREIERRAFAKIFKHPKGKEIWRQYLSGEIDEESQPPPLTREEINALLALARTPEEKAVITKVLRLVRN